MSASGKKVFGVGTLTLGAESVGVLQDVSIDIQDTMVPLYGANKFPELMAQGQSSVKGSAKFGEFNPTLVATLTNSAMGVDTGVALSWVVTGSDSKTITFAIAACHITGYKLQSSGDKWFVTDVTFEASAAASGNPITVTVAT